MDSHERCQLVIAILHATGDGCDLYQSEQEIERHGRNGDRAWLKFLENAVNGCINARGDELLQVFHRQILLGDYRYPVKDFLNRFLPGF